MPTDQMLGENFERLLAWLGTEREQAGHKYEQIRRNLVDYFRRREVLDPQSLADEVISRVTRRVDEVVTNFVGDPAAYFLAVARNVLAEWRRRPILVELPDNIQAPLDQETVETKELLLQSLEQCWTQLPPQEQRILLRYYVEIPPQKLYESREQLAQELGLTMNALRVVTHRLRRKLKRCIEKLLRRKA